MQIVAGRLKLLNNSTEFVAKLSRQADMPKWKDAMHISEGVNSTMGIGAKGAAKKKMYVVPFVKIGAKRVSALLLVKVAGADTAYKIVYRQHYPKYGFEEKAGHWNARKLMLLFAMMEEQLFGYKNFIVNDGRIMGGKIGDRIRISFEATTSSREPMNQLGLLVTTCKNYKSCFTVGGPYVCNTRSICKMEFVNDNDPGEWENMQPDESGGGGDGANDGGITDPDPCPVQTGTAQTIWQDASGTTYVLNPCDEMLGGSRMKL